VEIVRVFDDKECDDIISNIEKHSNKLKVSSDYGGLQLSAYEMSVDELDGGISDLISTKINQVSNKLGNIEINQLFIIKYSKDLINKMGGHYDACDYSLPINLSNDFVGGGTDFPILKHTHKPQEHPRGSGILFKANTVKSWHRALPVDSGVRYTLVVKFDGKKSVIKTLVEVFKTVILTKVVQIMYPS
jgi:hypothetical protein